MDTGTLVAVGIILLAVAVVVMAPGFYRGITGQHGDAGASASRWGEGVGPAPGQTGSVIPADRLPPVLTRTYHGKPKEVAVLQQVDAEALAERGYFPASQSYVEGRWSAWAWVLAVLAFIILVGILIFIYMIVDKPAGNMTVIYERKTLASIPTTPSVVRTSAPASDSPAPLGSQMKKCPDCAEEVRVEARVCRFCRHEFQASSIPERVGP